jgi:hypothetical protein
MMATIILPAYSSSDASLNAAESAAPDEMPPGSP